MRQAFTGTLQRDENHEIRLVDPGAGVFIEFSPMEAVHEHLQGFIGKRVVIWMQDVGEGTQ